ncbi:hypothetical protein OBBRIDRAFT_838210 [Obba rivulosa]|uniref:NmrA-like domain-containing protein n=1 Tax=Obba rivulosa TaxID=1052685 RepID=A0A8E2DFV1_9APHY|nr:hypothetical protein OBBRIDRAFT_838210 [Obba rivulosa]
MSVSSNICITAADGQTGHLIAELLLAENRFRSRVSSLTCLTMRPERCTHLAELGGHVVPHTLGDVDGLVSVLKAAAADTIILIPPAHDSKAKISQELIRAAREVKVPNGVLLSMSAAGFAEKETQPRLREFIQIEAEFMNSHGFPDVPGGHYPCIIRAGFYAENLLLCDKDVKKTGVLRLPIGETNQFAPVARADVALLTASVAISEGPLGLSNLVRGQLITITGPKLVSGPLLANEAKAAGVNLSFQDISETEAKDMLAGADIDDTEREYLLEFYSLVREGKTNYISTIPFSAVTGVQPVQPVDFFKPDDSSHKQKRRWLGK